MATGFETRQPGRDTFASQGPTVQSIGGRVALSGGGQVAQIVGGNASNSTSDNIHVTTPGPMAGDLGEFFAKTLQPYVERKQQEQFFQGMARAQAGESIDELNRNHNSIAGAVFGPTAFEKGAATYTAIDTANKWELAVTQNTEEWAKLSPEEQGKRLSEHSLSMMTDDPYTNQLLQKEIVNRTGPLLDTINKARWKWQQDTFHDNQFNAYMSAGDSLQAAAQAAAKVNDPSDTNAMAAVDTAEDNLASIFPPPAGQDPEMYKGTVTDTLNAFLQRGNMFAYKALVKRGALEAIGSDNAAKVLTSYDRWSKVVASKAKYDHAGDAIEIAERQAAGEYKSPLEAAAAWHQLNAKISQETGMDEPAYDAEKLVGAGQGVIDALVAATKQQATWEHEDGVRKQERALDKQDRLADEAAKGNAARAAMMGGYTATALATNAVDSGVNNAAYLEAYNSGNFAPLSNNAARGHTNDAVKQQINSMLTSSHGQAYGGDQKKAYETWSAFSKQDINGAIQYYGTANATRLMTMDRMIASGEPANQAYLFAFADTDPTKYSAINLSGHEMQTSQKAVETAVDTQGSTWYGRLFGGAPMKMTATTRNLLINETYRDVGVMMRGGSHEPPEVLAGAAVRTALSDGHLEIHGGSMSWLNPVGTKTMPTVTKLSPESFRDSLKAVVAHKFKASGMSAGVDGEYDVQRIGNDLMVWSAADGKIVHVTPQDIINEHHSHALRKAQANEVTTGSAFKQGKDSMQQIDNPAFHKKGWLLGGND